MPEGSPSVLIIRLDAVGDALALTPLLAALQSHAIPADVVLRPYNAQALAPSAARGFKIARFALRSDDRANLAAIEAFGASLQANRYSHVFVATEDPSGYRLAKAVGAPVRAGFADPFGKPLKALWTRGLLTQSVYRAAGLDKRAPHECEVLFSLASSLLGRELPTRDVERLRPLVLDAACETSDYVAVQITQKWNALGVAREEVSALVRRLQAAFALRGLAAASEAPYAQRVADACGLEISYFDELPPWKAAIASAAAVVAPDSGATHVAGMIGTPVVAVFPAGRDYALQVARWAPWAAPHRIVCADDGWVARASDALAQLRAT